MNEEITFLIQLADFLINLKKIRSYREFSFKYLNRSKNYLGTLKYSNRKPSLMALLCLKSRLHKSDLNQQFETLFHELLNRKILRITKGGEYDDF